MSDWHMEQFGTPSLDTEQDAVRDARIVELEAALRALATAPPLGASLARELDRRILIAREALGAVEVERIPDGVRWPKGEVVFTRWPVGSDGEWHLIGPAVMLEPGTVVEVSRFSERDSAVVAVGRIVAERTVIHKIEGPVRYVVARVSRAVRD